MKAKKTKGLEDYIYIRIGKEAKKKLKELGRRDGSNMTIIARQIIMKVIYAK